MYTKENLKEKLQEKGHFLEEEQIGAYLKNWRIDPIYEDENNIEYFDKMALYKLNQGIILKEQKYTDEEIILVFNKGQVNPETSLQVQKPASLPVSDNDDKELENITVNVTGQTMSMLAESIAQRISKEIADRIQDDNIVQSAMDTGKLRRDNEIMAEQIEKLLEENKQLTEKVNLLMLENTGFKNVFGNFYVKVDPLKIGDIFHK